MTTSQQQSIQIEKAQVTKIALNEAIELLETLTGKQDAAFPQLAKALNYLSLALQQAGTYIKNTPLLTASQYLRRYKKRKLVYLAKGQVSKAACISTKQEGQINLLIVTTTWEMNFAAIELYEKSSKQPLLSREILTLCSYLAPENIPYAIIQQWLLDHLPKPYAQVDLAHILARLQDYSMLTLAEDEKSASLHSLAQKMMRHQHRQQLSADSMDNWWQHLINNINRTFSQDTPLSENSLWDHFLLSHLQSLLHYAEKCAIKPVNQALLMRHIGYLLFNVLDDAKQAKTYYQRALKIVETHYGVADVMVTDIYLK